MSAKRNIHIETQLLRSVRLSEIAKYDVYLKFENSQPSGSFKLRGNGYHCQKEVERGCRHFVTASGGNTGIAVAVAGKELGVPVTVFLPNSTPANIKEKITMRGAQVMVHGKDFGETNIRAIEEGKKPGCSYIHPYLHPETWEGHSTIVDEIATQLGKGVKPGCFVISVGGGGLLRGLMAGMQRQGWQNVPIIAVETEGADCLDKAIKAGKPVELPAITSVAVTLGAKIVLPQLFDVLPDFNVHNYVVPDRQAVDSCIRFLDDERVLVEPACGAALTAVYYDLLSDVQPEGPVIVIVCGGGGVSIELLQKWARQFDIPFPGALSLELHSL